ncbi:MAG TPA: hypothetical protein VIS51_03960 [Solirubrobacterales bacterium]
MHDELDIDLPVEVPPNYSPGTLPDVEPFEAVPRARILFYGPVSGPFSIDVPGDKLQVGEEWNGYIAQKPNGEVSHIEAERFEKLYERFEPAAPDTKVAAKKS